jgi:hypothetical protein
MFNSHSRLYFKQQLCDGVTNVIFGSGNRRKAWVISGNRRKVRERRLVQKMGSATFGKLHKDIMQGVLYTERAIGFGLLIENSTAPHRHRLVFNIFGEEPFRQIKSK